MLPCIGVRQVLAHPVAGATPARWIIPVASTPFKYVLTLSSLPSTKLWFGHDRRTLLRNELSLQ